MDFMNMDMNTGFFFTDNIHTLEIAYLRARITIRSTNAKGASRTQPQSFKQGVLSLLELKKAAIQPESERLNHKEIHVKRIDNNDIPLKYHGTDIIPTLSFIFCHSWLNGRLIDQFPGSIKVPH